MLSQIRRFVIFAALASLLTLSFAPPAAAQTSQEAVQQCRMQYYEANGTMVGEDCDGDGVRNPHDVCPSYGPAYGDPPTDSEGCKDLDGPYADNDYDGVLNKDDSCPSEGKGTGGLDASGCPVQADPDGDGWGDSDACPNEPADKNNPWPDGCPGPAPLDLKDTPAASGPSCTKKMPCIVLERKGLFPKQHGGYSDPDATVKVTIARDAKGVPARIVDVELRNVDSYCKEYKTSADDWTRTPGPEVSVNLEPFALKKKRQRYANGGFFNMFVSDPKKAVRTIKGQKYEIVFFMDDDAGEAQLFIGWREDRYEGGCSIAIPGYVDRLERTKTAEEKKAVANCKKMPKSTKKQKRKRAKCLTKARA